MRKENSSKYKSKIKPLVIKLNNFTTFTFYILRKNAFKKDPYDKWCRVYINIKNKFINYTVSDEILLEFEVLEIIKYIELLLTKNLKEDISLDFIEPDLKLKFFKYNLMKICINLYQDNLLSDEQYILHFNKKEMLQLYNYLVKIFNFKNSLKNSNRRHLLNKKKYCYVTVRYLDNDYKDYYYISDDFDIKISDYVLVERRTENVVGIVTSKCFYYEYEVPYPVNKTKKIIEILENELDIPKFLINNNTDTDDEMIESKMISTYHKMFLNNMFGRILISHLISVLRYKFENKFVSKVYYNKRMNLFFYIDKEENYNLFFEENVLNKTEYEILAKESIIVKVEDNDLIGDDKYYLQSIEFCKSNNLVYYDDTDILLYNKARYILRKKYPKKENKIEKFENIEQIEEFLENYKNAEYKYHDPPYVVKNEHIVFFSGYFDYDLRIFYIPEFLVKNGYIFEEYYDKEKYPEFFEDNIKDYDFDNLDIKRISYFILRIFYIERFCEGIINEYILRGSLLKAIKRAKYLKSNDKNK